MMRDGRAFLVMEYLKGLDLSQWLRSKRPTDVGIASRYLKAACDAVAALHRNGIIHRDIKPSNLMIAAQPGGGSIVKIVDFGFVRPAISDETMDSTGGLVVGTPEFMAPELFSGGKPDVLSDIYALGVTTYEVFTGELPFGVGSFREMFERHSHEPPRPPTSIRPDLPVEVDAIVARSLAKNREHRYASAEAMAVEFAYLSRNTTRGDTGSLVRHEGAPSSDERETKLASILLVEDDRVVRQLFVAHLERRMFEVVTASDGIEAFIQLGKRKFDLVISDIQMPNLNGMELLRLKSEKGIDTPVIFLTGSATEGEEKLAVERGAAGFIHKSPRVDELIAKINEVLGLN
jgi:serine/threonine protein kinase